MNLRHWASRLWRKINRGKIVFEAKSKYNHIRVQDKCGQRYLVFIENGGYSQQPPEKIYQSVISLNGNSLDSKTYVDYFALPLDLVPGIQKVLVVGLGGGTVPLKYLPEYPQITIDAVEIDEMVVDVARKYFSLSPSPRLRIFIADGRDFLQSCTDKYDYMIIDAFFSRSIPFRLTTAEFFDIAQKKISPRGVIALNINNALQGAQSMLFRSLYKTISSVFPHVMVLASRIAAPYSFQNIFFFASSEPFGLPDTGTIFESKVYRDTVPLAGVKSLHDHRPPNNSGLLDLYSFQPE